MEVISSLDKLKRYGYPPVLCEIVNRFSEYSLSFFFDQEPGILLIGSTARGELSWAKVAGNVKLFSDIEFLVVVADNNKTKEREFSRQIQMLEDECELGELFHIDFTIITWKKLTQLDKKFFIFECRECGIDFGEKAVRAELPVVDLSSLNWKELNEVLLHRLSSILHMVPLTLINEVMTENEKLAFTLGLAKNTLDLTTWLHPYEANELTAGFGSRLASWDIRFLEEKILGKYFSVDDISYIDSCLAKRRAPCEIDFDPVVMLDKTLLLYGKGIAYCKAMNAIEDESSVGSVLSSIKLFDEYRFRQRVSQLASLLANLDKVGIVKVLRNSMGVRKGVAADFCQYMLLAFTHYTKGNEESWSYLILAQKELSRLSSVSKIQKNDFVNEWGNLRACFKQYQEISHNS